VSNKLFDLVTGAYKVFNCDGVIYLVVINEDMHGVGKELWKLNDKLHFEFLGLSAYGIPADVPSAVEVYFWQQITKSEFEAWNSVNGPQST
jgi:hypothetical protein